MLNGSIEKCWRWRRFSDISNRGFLKVVNFYETVIDWFVVQYIGRLSVLRHIYRMAIITNIHISFIPCVSLFGCLNRRSFGRFQPVVIDMHVCFFVIVNILYLSPIQMFSGQRGTMKCSMKRILNASEPSDTIRYCTLHPFQSFEPT